MRLPNWLGLFWQYMPSRCCLYDNPQNVVFTLHKRAEFFVLVLPDLLSSARLLSLSFAIYVTSNQPEDCHSSFFSGLHFYNQTCCRGLLNSLTSQIGKPALQEAGLRNYRYFILLVILLILPAASLPFSSLIPIQRYLLSYPRELFLNFYRVLLFAQPPPSYHVQDL